MNMLPIRSEWKRRIKWAEKQRKEKTGGQMSKKVRLTCDYCGNEFFRFPSAVKERNFCSRSCDRKDRSKKGKSPGNQERWHQLVLDFDA